MSETTQVVSSEPTPGPWRVESGCVVAPWSKQEPVRNPRTGEETMHPTGLIALAYTARPDGDWTGPGSADANACLIAAAPDLLDALRLVVEMADRQPFCSVGFVVEHIAVGARAAIAKAEGREP